MVDMVKSVKQIFADQVFYVPDYQRGYAWEDQQCQDLLDDLELLSETGRHYTGTLVVGPHGENAAPFIDANMQEYLTYDIIDGQQRIATIVMLLKAIYDEMMMIPQCQTLAASLCDTYLYTNDRNGQAFTKLKLNPDSQDFFANDILALRPGVTGPTIRSHQRLRDAQVKFANFLEDKRSKLAAYPAWLQSFYGKVINQLKLIFYPVTDELDAGVIFETMNDRGKPLTEMEKVKNHLLYLSAKLDVPDEGHPLNRRINETWKFIYEKLMFAGLAGRANEDQLLRAHWLMTYNYDISKWDNARSIKGRYNLKDYREKHKELLNDLLVYLDSLQNAATAYCDIYSPQLPNAFNNFSDSLIRAQVVLWSRKIARQGVRAAYLPALIALHMQTRDGGEAYLSIVQLLEKFTFRIFTLKRMRSNAGQTALFRLGYQYYQNHNAEWLREEIGQLLLLYSPNTEYEKGFQKDGVNWYEWDGINYFLYEYEHHLAGGRPVELTWESLSSRSRASSIEHILPQTPTDSAWLERFPEKERQHWTHDFANLTLTYDNSSLGNRKFMDKKGAPGRKGTYANSPLFVEKEIAGYTDWNEASLLDRRTKIEAWALDRWKVDFQPRQPQERKTIESMIAFADEFGLGEDLEAIHQCFRRLKIWPTIRKGLQYRNPYNYHQTLFYIYVRSSGFEVYFYPDKFTSFPGITPEEVRERIGLKSGWNWLEGENITTFMESLKRFEQRINGHALKEPKGENR
jgi:hypothetical protein